MPTLTITKSYADDEVLTEGQLDDIKNSIEQFINTTKLGSDNLQDSSVGSAQIAATSITTGKIASNAVTDAKLASSASSDIDRAVGTDHIKDSSVTTAKLNDSAVTTSKLNDGSVTKAKLGSLGQQVSSSSGIFSTTSSSATAVTNLSVNITTVGRPVKLELISASTTESSTINSTGNITMINASGYISFRRDGSAVGVYALNQDGSGQLEAVGPYSFIDIPSAGTYTYSVYVASNGTGTIGVRNIKLIAYEL
jgi:hypothetical protein